jgi:hypothetical protein
MSRRGGDQYPLRQGEWHDIAIVVVGVFTDQVDPTRGSPHPYWLPAGPNAEGLDEGGGVIAHPTHCIGRDHLTLWSGGPAIR